MAPSPPDPTASSPAQLPEPGQSSPSTWWGRGCVLVCLALQISDLCKLESTWAWKDGESIFIVEIEPH